MKKVVITGATGMIGRALISYLLEKNIKILAIVRDERKLSNYNNLNLKVIEYNLSNINKIHIPKEKYDVFFHLAWDGTFGEDRNNIVKQNENIFYTLDSVRLAKKLGCHTFIGTGSQAEYGRVEGKIGPKTKTNPETAYGKAKLEAGKLSRDLAIKLGIKHIWTRILSIYGPYDREETMVMSSIASMLNGNSPEYTKAEQMWDYLYVEDIVRALYLIAENGKENSIYCIGSGKQKPLREYIEEIKSQINPKLELKIGTKEYAQNQVINLCADISNLTKDTGFIPQIDFKEGIRRTIKWYKENKFEKD